MKVKKISFIHSEKCDTDFLTSEDTALDLKSHVTSDTLLDSVEHLVRRLMFGPLITVVIESDRIQIANSLVLCL